MRLRTISTALLLFLLLALATAQAETVKVLSVGNSFSQNAQKFFTQITEASGNTTIAKNAMIGGCDLERHMRHVDAFEANADDPQGHPYPGGQSLKELLTEQQWDYVTIQQVSYKSFRPETYHPHVDRLIAYIRKHAPQAEIVIHQTWAYRDDHPFWGDESLNPDVMYRGLRSAYDKLAKEEGLRLIPCGDAMEAARRDPAWGKFVPDTSFDPKHAVYPALPTQEKHALHNGYSWRKDSKTNAYTLRKDCIHANSRGEYLLGCVWFEFFFGKSVVGNSFRPKNVSAADAAVMQRIAHQVVTDKQRPEPIP